VAFVLLPLGVMIIGTSVGIPVDAELVPVTAAAVASVEGSQLSVPGAVPVGRMTKGRLVGSVSIEVTDGVMTGEDETDEVVMGGEAVDVTETGAVEMVLFELPEPVGPVGDVPFEIIV